MIKMPKMILFDYGNTIVRERTFDSIKGVQSVMKYAKKGKFADIKLIAQRSDEIFAECIKCAKTTGLEVHNLVCQRALYEYFKIEFTVSDQEIEKIFWDSAAPGIAMEGMNSVLNLLNDHGIRSGVISNMTNSGTSLHQRIDEIFPQNEFEVFLTSGDYLYRKPNHLLFDIALKRAGLAASDVWFCGDNYQADVLGAKGAGLFPVCFDVDSKLKENEFNFEHIYIQNWTKFIKDFEKLISQTAM